MLNSEYHRVVPRDLFNEAKLLKCLGKLIIEGEQLGITVEHDGDPFRVCQDPNSGWLYCDNVRLFHQKFDTQSLDLYISYNSKDDPYPMWLDVYTEDDECCDSIKVFYPDGTLTNEFKKLFLDREG